MRYLALIATVFLLASCSQASDYIGQITGQGEDAAQL